MSSNHLTLYLADVFKLAKTLTIKSEYSAEQMNAEVTTKHGSAAVDPNNPRSWKYYRNISGEYHQHDAQMNVVSLDTLESIVFDKANLELHPATLSGYQYGTRYYKELIARFPEQEILILGILNPADIDAAIAAENYSVVAWDKQLVESNEEDLIVGIDTFCKNFANRWHVSGFNITHNLYDISFNNTLYQLLNVVIMQLRDEACNTPQAHSFHVRMHLASHQGLDEFLPYLTQEQAMWLYRNIAFIEKNAGKTAVFQELIANILTKRGIPLRGFDVVHRNGAIGAGDTKPEVGFMPVGLNSVRVSTPEMINPSTMQFKVSPVAVGNPDYELRHPTELEDIGYSEGSRYATKVLESTIIEITESSSVTLVEQALSLWVYAACKNNFNVFTRVNHPITGVEMTMSALDAYYLFLYSYSKAHSSGLLLVPALYAARAPVWPTPALTALNSLVIESSLPADFSSKMRASAYNVHNYINLPQFRKGIEAARQSLEEHALYMAWPSTFNGKTSASLMLEAMWSEATFERPETGTPIVEYLATKELEFGEMEVEYWQALYMQIFSDITGMQLETTATQSDIQKAMIAIMERLSSYTVMYIKPNSAMAVRSLNHSNMLIEPELTTSTNYYDVPIFNMEMTHVPTPRHYVFDVPVDVSVIDGIIVTKEAPRDILHTAEITQIDNKTGADYDMMFLPIGMTPVNKDGEEDIGYIPGLQETIDSGVPFDEVPNIYNFECTPKLPVPGPVDPNDWIGIHELPIVKAFPYRDPILGDFKAFSVPGRLRYFGKEEEIILLNGIWASHGETELPVFVYSGGNTLLDLFRYMPYFDDMVLKEWVASIGDVKVDEFSLPDFMKEVFIIDGLSGMSYSFSMMLEKNKAPMTVDIGFTSSGGIYSWAWRQGQSEVTFGLEKLHDQHVISGLTNGHATVVFNFSHYDQGLDLGGFTTFATPFIMDAFTSSGGVYSMLPFEATAYQFDAGYLRNYHHIQLTFDKVQDGLDNVQPDSGFGFNAHPQVATEIDVRDTPAKTAELNFTAAQGHSELELNMLYDVIDLGDLRDHM